MSELNPLSGETLDLTKENIEKLKELFPEVLTENQIDFEKLRLILGDEINDKPEKYSFSWNGKKDAIKLAQQPSTGTLRPIKEKSKNWNATENLYIEGDNLEVLKLLQKSYAGKVDVIYIDPPYNTGNDFVYQDDFQNNIENYLKLTNQLDEAGNKFTTNVESSGRFHTDWLNMMYPRMILAKNLLAEDGVIFISIDDSEVHNLRKMSDEIFGENNFITNIIWQKKFSRSNDAEYFSEMHDNILCYRKSTFNKWSLNLLPRGEEIPKGYSNPDNDERGPWTSVILSAKSGSDSMTYKITGPTGKTFYPPSGRYWAISKETYKKLLADNRIWFGVKGDAAPRRKTFLSEVQDGLRPNSIWFHKDVGHNQEGRQEVKKLFNGLGVFDSPKPVRLIETILQIASDKESLVLDFFSGSSTTAHAVMKINQQDAGNRKYIMVQIPEPVNEKSEAYKNGYNKISEIGIERISHAGDKILNDNSNSRNDLDTGYKVFELDSSNIQKWTMDSENLEESLFSMENNFVEGRSHSDIVYEILLKLGLDLNTHFEESTVDESTVYDVAFGNVYIVLGNTINQEVANHIADKQKDYQNENPSVVFNDNGFVSDNEKLNSIEILKNNGFNEEQLMSI